ncbi:MAG: sugar ABC transporter ATP-binding protein, partial [Actinomycetota bacterium]
MDENILEINNISKVFPGVIALNDVSFAVKRNTIHCIVGENGAGKSTLIKILMGAYKRTSGSLFFEGKEYDPKNVKESMNMGINTIYQEINVVETLTVEQNLNLGIEENKLGVIKRIKKTDNIYKILKEIDSSIKLSDELAGLSVAQKQTVAITKVIASKTKVLILDEPTASLSEFEVSKLFEILMNLKKQGITIIYITHKLNEIFEIGDYVTTLRDGNVIETKQVKDVTSKSELINMMFGKVFTEKYIPAEIDRNIKALELLNIKNKVLKGINFELFKGEILGFYGLIGSGKTEIARVIYGLDKKEGIIKLFGKDIKSKNPLSVISKGISMIPEERRTQGLFTELSISENIVIMNTKKISRFGITSAIKERSIAKYFIKRLMIAAKSESQIVAFLSGGNQQKVVISKCLNAESTIILLDEPTRGVDVSAKEEIHKLIRGLARESGVSIIVFSSELEEILTLSDRIVLLYEG